MSDAGHTSYDEVPTTGYPFSQTHPDRLETVPRLLGVGAAPADRCRVLELGCTDGGNLIPMAVSLPGSSFHGIDLSGRQIAAARKIIQALELENIEVRHLDIAQVGGDFGTFDYIICHGVYSWVPARSRAISCESAVVPESARRGLRQLQHLSRLAYSRNDPRHDVLPHQAVQRPERPSPASPEAARVPGQVVCRTDRAVRHVATRRIAGSEPGVDSYVLHEHLEEVNEPLYFYQFVERATARRLQYLGEADLAAMAPTNFPPEVRDVLQMMATDVAHLEQYMDFVRNRTFRQTLLCHEGIRLSPRLRVEDLAGFYVASPARPVAERPDLHSLSPEQFRTPGGSVISVSQPISKAAMLDLSEKWPRDVSVAELGQCAWQRLSGRASSQGATEAEELQIMGQSLVSAYTAARARGL